jgi:plastocyanin
VVLTVVRVLFPLAIAATLSSALSAQPSSGIIRGRLTLPVPERHDRRPALVEPATTVRERPPRVGVVYLESAPAGAFEEAVNARSRMDQRHETFVPHVLAIRMGTTVDFPNNDRIYHNVFSLSPTRRFDLGRYAVGRSKAVRFDRPGVVRVFCDIHSHMNAFIVVFSHRFFAVTQPDGDYQLPPVPPGTYTVVGWYEGEVKVSRQVTVRAGETVAVDMQVP